MCWFYFFSLSVIYLVYASCIREPLEVYQHQVLTYVFGIGLYGDTTTYQVENLKLRIHLRWNSLPISARPYQTMKSFVPCTVEYWCASHVCQFISKRCITWKYPGPSGLRILEWIAVTNLFWFSNFHGSIFQDCDHPRFPPQCLLLCNLTIGGQHITHM